MDISVEQLKRDWDKMRPLDRARSVAVIRKSGSSIRQIAKQLGRSESLLRHLLHARLASAEDLKLAREGKITTNELVRRADATRALDATQQRENAQQKRSVAAAKAADLNCNWLEETQLNGPSCEVIIDQVRRELAERKMNGELPARPKQILRPVDEIISIAKPPKQDDSITVDGWYAGWLCRWVFWAFPDADIRSSALDSALEHQWNR